MPWLGDELVGLVAQHVDERVADRDDIDGRRDDCVLLRSVQACDGGAAGRSATGTAAVGRSVVRSGGGRRRRPDGRGPAVERGALLERAAERLDDRAELRLVEPPGRGSRPRPREMFSSISVPPRSLQPACSTWRAPATPVFTHDTWTLSIQPRYAMRPTACISSTSRNVGPGRALPCRKIGVAMCTNGSGTNSVKPPVSCCSVAGAHEVAGDVHRPLDVAEHDRDVRAQADRVRGAVRFEPLLGVDLVGADDRADLVVEDLGRGAGQRGEPGFLGQRAGSRARSMPSRRAPSVTSSAVNPWTWMSGATSFTARATSR